MAKKKSKLDSMIVKPKDIESNLRVCLYGPSGSGKTTLAATFPKPILLVDIKEKTESVVRNIKNLDILRLEKANELDELYWLLEKEPTRYKTIIIDTITKFQDLVVDGILERKNQNVDSKDEWKPMHQQDWGKLSSEMKVNILNFCDLPMNVVFIAQDRENTIEQPAIDDVDGEVLSYAEVGPACVPSVAKTLNASVEILGTTFILEKVKRVRKKVKGKLKLEKTRETQYCLRVGPHAVFRSKVRAPKELEIPSYITDPTFDKLIKISGR